jgi:hypothetical protein
LQQVHPSEENLESLAKNCLDIYLPPTLCLGITHTLITQALMCHSMLTQQLLSALEMLRWMLRAC